jgi:hypothetical protein
MVTIGVIRCRPARTASRAGCRQKRRAIQIIPYCLKQLAGLTGRPGLDILESGIILTELLKKRTHLILRLDQDHPGVRKDRACHPGPASTISANIDNSPRPEPTFSDILEKHPDVADRPCG